MPSIVGCTIWGVQWPTWLKLYHRSIDIPKLLSFTERSWFRHIILLVVAFPDLLLSVCARRAHDAAIPRALVNIPKYFPSK